MRKLIAIATLLLFLLPTQVNAKEVIDMGTFKLTAYCPCKSCSDNWGRKTKSGKMATPNHTVAADLTVMNIGDKITINGEEYVVEDCGAHVKGDHLDIFFDTHEEVDAFANGKGIAYGNVLIWR